jgi:hypothetical protein
VRLEEGHHAWSSLQESVDLDFIEGVAQHMAQVGAWRFQIFDDPGSPGERVQGRPHPTAGPGRGAAERRLLFRDNHLQLMPGGSHRR